VSWNMHHSESERLAAEAESARKAGEIPEAEELYRKAAVAESAAFDALEIDKLRTRGVTAVSAVALWYKARDYPLPSHDLELVIGLALFPLVILFHGGSLL
jgi:hypothetical protein